MRRRRISPLIWTILIGLALTAFLSVVLLALS